MPVGEVWKAQDAGASGSSVSRAMLAGMRASGMVPVGEVRKAQVAIRPIAVS